MGLATVEKGCSNMVGTDRENSISPRKRVHSSLTSVVGGSVGGGYKVKTFTDKIGGPQAVSDSEGVVSKRRGVTQLTARGGGRRGIDPPPRPTCLARSPPSARPTSYVIRGTGGCLLHPSRALKWVSGGR